MLTRKLAFTIVDCRELSVVAVLKGGKIQLGSYNVPACLHLMHIQLTRLRMSQSSEV
jgi:hypothetical protein